MRKTGFWASPWTLIVSSIILPPLGLVLLWKSRQSLFVKTVLSALLLVYMGSAGSAVYTSIAQAKVPRTGFDVSRNALGQYRYPKILDLEAQVFDSVVRLERESRPYKVPDMQDSTEPNEDIFETVATKFGLEPYDVEDIYLKVSILQARDIKRK